MKLEWLLQYSYILFEGEKFLWCTLCNSVFICTRQHHIVKGPEHLQKVQFSPGPSKPAEHNLLYVEFCMDLCGAFNATDIPL